MIRWNGAPLKCSGSPVALPAPASPVHSCLKFSAVCAGALAGQCCLVVLLIEHRTLACAFTVVTCLLRALVGVLIRQVLCFT